MGHGTHFLGLGRAKKLWRRVKCSRLSMMTWFCNFCDWQLRSWRKECGGQLRKCRELGLGNMRWNNQLWYRDKASYRTFNSGDSSSHHQLIILQRWPQQSSPPNTHPPTQPPTIQQYNQYNGYSRGAEVVWSSDYNRQGRNCTVNQSEILLLHNSSSRSCA